MTDKPESLLSFPCDFPIKAVGRAAGDFEALVAEIVRRHAPDLGENAIASRPSKGGKFTAVTVTVRAMSQAQLDAIYGDLCASTEIIMAL